MQPDYYVAETAATYVQEEYAREVMCIRNTGQLSTSIRRTAGQRPGLADPRNGMQFNDWDTMKPGGKAIYRFDIYVFYDSLPSWVNPSTVPSDSRTYQIYKFRTELHECLHGGYAIHVYKQLFPGNLSLVYFPEYTEWSRAEVQWYEKHKVATAGTRIDVLDLVFAL